jgi:hypothetical protein
MDDTYPTDADQLGPDWYTAALRSTGTIGDEVTVAECSAEEIGIGVGVLGLLWRVQLGYEGGSGPATAVLKLPHTAEESRHIARAFRFYQAEVGFYRDAAGRSPMRTAGCYAASVDDDTGDFYLLMEDLAGRRVHDQLAGCPPEDAALDLRSLAAHHAAWWDSPDLTSLPWLTRIVDPPTPQALVPSLRHSWPVIEANFAHLLRGPMLQAAERMPDVCVELMERLSQPPVTLLHGDHRLDNMFFGDDEVAVVDWQICTIGRSAYDVAYFLSQSLVPEERKAAEEDLLRTYHAALVEHGVDGGAYSFEDCWEDYRLATLFCAVYPLNAGSVDLVNDRAVELFTSMLDRSVSAILDLDALELL